MPDRVKAALFSLLGSYFDVPGRLPPLRVADVFAGSGSMGLEALSRGAATCTFFERDPVALKALKRNCETLEAAGQARIVTRDAWRAAVAEHEGQPFGLMLLDPPYRDALDTTTAGPVLRLVARVMEHGPKTLIVLHHPSKVHYTVSHPDRWRTADRRTFGTNAITLFSS